MVDIDSDGGKGLHPAKGGIQKKACHPIKEEHGNDSHHQAHLFVVVPVLLPPGAEPRHTQHKKAEQKGDSRENQGLVFASPPVDLTVDIIMGGDLLRQNGQGRRCRRQRQEHEDTKNDFLRFHG